MKKKKTSHPKLFTNIEIENSLATLFFIDNKFNQNGERLINNEIIQIDNKIDCVKSYIFNKNKEEYYNLIKYIIIQKKVLKKHQKSGNYDSSRVVESSILVMEKFKNEFDDWFKVNKVS